jgi:predicted nucleic acid-binding protein
VIQLDTRFLIRSLVPDSAEATTLRRWLEDGESVGISALAWAEFQCGPVTARVIEIAERLLGHPMSFGAPEAALAATLFNESGRRRGTLVDCMIAATAILAGDSLATSNPKDYARFEQLGLVISERPGGASRG